VIGRRHGRQRERGRLPVQRHRHPRKAHQVQRFLHLLCASLCAPLPLCLSKLRPKPWLITRAAAVAWGPGEPLSVEEVEVAPPGRLEVRVKVLFTSICHTDLGVWKAEVINTVISFIYYYYIFACVSRHDSPFSISSIYSFMCSLLLSLE
jgi:hypothetical protein